MTISQILHLQSMNACSIYLLPQGAFYHVYNEGAEKLSMVTGYKIRKGSVYARSNVNLSKKYRFRCIGSINYTFCGFPISALDNVIVRLVKHFAPLPIGIEHIDTAIVIIIG